MCGQFGDGPDRVDAQGRYRYGSPGRRAPLALAEHDTAHNSRLDDRSGEMCRLSLVFYAGAGPFPSLAQAPPPPRTADPRQGDRGQGYRRVQSGDLGRVSPDGNPSCQPQRSKTSGPSFPFGSSTRPFRVGDFGARQLTYGVAERPSYVTSSSRHQSRRVTLLEKIERKLGPGTNGRGQPGRDKLKDVLRAGGYFEVGIAPEVERLADGDVNVTFRCGKGPHHHREDRDRGTQATPRRSGARWRPRSGSLLLRDRPRQPWTTTSTAIIQHKTITATCRRGS